MKCKWLLFWVIVGLYLLGTVSIGYTTYNSPAPKGGDELIETIKIVFLCLGGLGIILPTYINATNAIEERTVTRIENTFALITKWDDPHLFSARKLTRDIKLRRSSISDDELIQEINENDELKQSVHLVCNYFEQVRFSIDTGRINLDLFKPVLGALIIDIINRFMPYINTIGDVYVQDLNKLKKSLES
ncbi:DUF4760 domain-containing protein [Aliivibrio fischeri]|uniref:DUF4760 domain-containing protein n=1 Tax=Aliivibrio fischeri TaxID=668 RepID=UPI0037364FD9